MANAAKVFRILILVILIIVVITSTIGLVFLSYGKLQPENLLNTVYNFTATSGQNADLTCPTDSVINILDAWFEVYDPYFQCTPYPTPGAMGVTASGSVTSKDKNLASGWNEISGDLKNPFTNIKYEDYPDNTFNYGMCQLDSSGNPTAGGKCRSSNALGYLIENVNGSQKATVSADTSPQGGSQGGPSPCLPANTSELQFLPIGGQYNEDNTGGSKFANGYQGYYIHGVYSCVPKNE